MRESDFQSLFAKWVRTQKWRESYAFELKITKTNTLPISHIEEHQRIALLAAKHSFRYHKISDLTPGFKPFDCFVLAKARAELAVMYYKPRQPKYFYSIDIDRLEDFIATGARSISEAEAQGLGVRYPLPSK